MCLIEKNTFVFIWLQRCVADKEILFDLISFYEAG